MDIIANISAFHLDSLICFYFVFSGIRDRLDNCKTIYNPLQSDRDGDTVGDECDNCPRKYNPTQVRGTVC